MFAHPGLLTLLQQVAEDEGIPVQYKAPGLGSTDTGAIHLTRARDARRLRSPFPAATFTARPRF